MLLPHGNPRRLGQLKKVFRAIRERRVTDTRLAYAESGPRYTEEMIANTRHHYRPGNRSALTYAYLSHKYRTKPPKWVREVQKMSGESSVSEFILPSEAKALTRYENANTFRDLRKASLKKRR